MTTHSRRAGDLKGGDLLLDAGQYLTVIGVGPVPREPKRVQVTLQSRHGKEITLYIDCDTVVAVRRA